MRAQDELRQAIQLMQERQVEVAAGMLNRLVSDAELDAQGRAAAYVWLAESRDDYEYKLACLERALECEPENSQIRQGLNQLKSARPQVRRSPALGRTVQLERAPRVVGIGGGVNGNASAVFIDGDGLLATTAYAIGGSEHVRVMIDNLPEARGVVLRRHPLYDLAFVSTAVKLARKPAIAPPGSAGESQTAAAFAYYGSNLHVVLTYDDRLPARHWLGSNIPLVQVPDAGGNPLYDERGQLLGILTRSIDRAGRVYALKISQVLALAGQLRRERQLRPGIGYCQTCGSLTRAPLYGGPYCETCGGRLRSGRGPQSAPQWEKLLPLYGENQSRPCPACGARVGYYAGRCLRCGRAVAGD